MKFYLHLQQAKEAGGATVPYHNLHCSYRHEASKDKNSIILRLIISACPLCTEGVCTEEATGV
jgi:hypothetical protein